MPTRPSRSPSPPRAPPPRRPPTTAAAPVTEPSPLTAPPLPLAGGRDVLLDEFGDPPLSSQSTYDDGDALDHTGVDLNMGSPRGSAGAADTPAQYQSPAGSPRVDQPARTRPSELSEAEQLDYAIALSVMEAEEEAAKTQAEITMASDAELARRLAASLGTSRQGTRKELPAGLPPITGGVPSTTTVD